ncbi:MAG TPA: 1,6-anhydro-N-acetylmuramyl-L-alanine amidase AmpD [Thiotrichaceae bacterium]|nr:1,6-anhydro-N-acetylmuramyl-L-alanine amidase AmpD [Thiotrichaceae bacterium]
MTIEITTGLLEQADYIASPNCDERPEGELSLVVIHNISLPPNKFGGDHISDLFTNQLDTTVDPFFSEIEALRVSSHLLINRQGKVTQYVPFHQRAWHAGVSQYLGRSQCNDFSIGIELEGTDFEPFTEVQYETLIECLRSINLAYPSIELSQITGHEHIAPSRKTDPGPHFMWQKLAAAFGVELPAVADQACS